ncbi:MAG: flagellar hook-basal body complex protein [Magnetococcales bacterium]|nr:flagellar hook-basal body complex protein [Magnetococcales bacterium]
MSIMQAMYAGASALTNFSESITVIGNNLANSNTTAFKSSSASFEDVLIQTVGNSAVGAATQIGTGMGLAGVQQDMTQGSFAPSANVTDLSIDGRGFFKVRSLDDTAKLDNAGNPMDIFYTRAGEFRKDKTGALVNPAGMVLQGWELDSNGRHGSTVTDVNIANYLTAQPVATTLVTVGANLDSTAEAISPNTVYNPNDPSTYNFSTAVRVFDSRGAGHNLEIQFRKLPMGSPATVVGGLGVTSTRQSLGSMTENGTAQYIQMNGLAFPRQQVTMTFTPVVGGVSGTPVVTDPFIMSNEDPTVDTSQLLVGDSPLELVDGTTYAVTYTSTRQEIGLDLSKEASVSLKFTPVSGGTPIQADAIDLPAGHNGIDLRTGLMADGEPIKLAKGTRYTVSYTTDPADTPATGTTPAVRVVQSLTGDDSRAEILGAASDNTWEWHAVVKTSELDPTQQANDGGALTVLSSATAAPSGAGYTVGQLQFNSRGQLLKEGSTPLSVLFKGIKTDGETDVKPKAQEILFDFGTAVGTNGDSTNDFVRKTLEDVVYDRTLSKLVEESNTGGTTGTVQVAGGFATTKLEQNGFPLGSLDKINIDADGIVSGSYTNSQTKKLFQIVLVDFADETALEQKGGNLFAQSRASGEALPGEPQSGRLGSVVAYSLEQSNVDMSGEFVRMITTQRGFQANSRIVTVVDGMMEELLSLKR